MGDPEEEMDGEIEADEVDAVPELWKYAGSGQAAPDGGNAPGPRVGMMVKFLNEKEDDELLEELGRRNPGTGQSLLMWAVLQQKFVLVEWLIKKAKRNAFVFSDADKEMTIYDKFQEKKKEREQEEKERLEALAEAGGEAEEDEEKEDPPPLHEVVKGELGDDEGIDDFKIRRVGELGVYQGQRDPVTHAKTGLGQTLFTNGDAYIGEYLNNKRHGFGCYYWASTGEIYIGDWKNNQRCGTGRMVDSHGGRYYGTWKADAQTGKGRYTYSTGDTYAGDFLNGMRHGTGTYTVASDTSKFTGSFSRGEFVTGKWCLASGVTYYGVFKDFKPVGRGIFFFKAASPDTAYTQAGTYTDGVWQPSDVKRADDVRPCLEVLLKDKPATLRFGKACVGYSIEHLVQVANFPPLLRWLDANPWTARRFHVSEMTVHALDSGPTGLLKSVTLSPKLEDEFGQRPTDRLGLVDPYSLTFCEGRTVLLPILRSQGNEPLLVYVKQPQAVCGDLSTPQLMPVTVLADGTFDSPLVDALRDVGVGIAADTVLDVSKLVDTNDGQGLLLNPEESSAMQQVLYFTQEVTPQYWETIEQRLQSVSHPAASLHTATVRDFLKTTPDAASVASTYLVTALLEAGTLPSKTCDNMRPPTPPPPVPEPRPEMCEPLQEEPPEPAPAEEEPEEPEE